MPENIELVRFRTELINDIIDFIRHEEDGGIREEKFTELALEYLEEAGETEGARSCREIKENSIGNRLHKINGYAISEGYETIDLFITVYKGTTNLVRLYADDIKSAVNLSTRFLYNILGGKIEGIEETAPVFDFVNTINKIAKDLVRVNIYILSDVLIPYDPPKQTEFKEILIQYHLRDIEYLYRIHALGSGRKPIEIVFKKDYGGSIPCLATFIENKDYSSYLAIIQGEVLANIYREYGARLLEQNVRTFLQFRGKINKGIRDTILKEPHMFMAYNNGISATAESIELDANSNAIISIKDFQIVNGGQTTASIFQTRRKFKDANLQSVSVQLKLTVIKEASQKAEIVSRISRYANTQNKVSESDLTSNHPFHIEVETFSRKIWAPPLSGKNQTRWFYERARGQYNDELSKIDSVKKKRIWQNRNPKQQKFAKEDLARFYNAWNKKAWWVVRGRQRNFVEFMKGVDNIDVDQIFYEDLIAKAILFRTSEKLYGRGIKAIGDLRYIVVPYAVSWLSHNVDENLNLLKIWENQLFPNKLQELLFITLKKVDSFMRKTAPGGLIGEWAKKEDCWLKLKQTNLEIDTSNLFPYLYTKEEKNERYKQGITLTEEDRNYLEESLKDIGQDGWIKLGQWGKATGEFNSIQLNFIWKIVRKLELKKQLSDKDFRRVSELIKIIESSSPEILDKIR